MLPPSSRGSLPSFQNLRLMSCILCDVLILKMMNQSTCVHSCVSRCKLDLHSLFQPAWASVSFAVSVNSKLKTNLGFDRISAMNSNNKYSNKKSSTFSISTIYQISMSPTCNKLVSNQFSVNSFEGASLNRSWSAPDNVRRITHKKSHKQIK